MNPSAIPITTAAADRIPLPKIDIRITVVNTSNPIAKFGSEA